MLQQRKLKSASSRQRTWVPLKGRAAVALRRRQYIRSQHLLPQASERVLRSSRLLSPVDPRLCRTGQALIEATKEGQDFTWTKDHQLAFDKLKQSQLLAPALGLPDVARSFYLYIDTNKGVGKGVLTQTLGPWQWPITYLSKKLDSVAAGWPPCLCIIAVIAQLAKDADKLIWGQNLIITTPCT